MVEKWSTEWFDRLGEFEGLTKVDEIELDNMDYSFYLLGLWKDDKTGEFYLGTDSGCSCPTPWENHDDRSDLTGPLTAAQAREETESLFKIAQSEPDSYRPGIDQHEAEIFLTNFN